MPALSEHLEVDLEVFQSSHLGAQREQQSPSLTASFLSGGSFEVLHHLPAPQPVLPLAVLCLKFLTSFLPQLVEGRAWILPCMQQVLIRCLLNEKRGWYCLLWCK